LNHDIPSHTTQIIEIIVMSYYTRTHNNRLLNYKVHKYLLGCCCTGLLAYQPPPVTGGLQHDQMPTPKLLRRCKQTGLDAKGVTTELLRLKFYCS
jgi:hypothetical protein